MLQAMVDKVQRVRERMVLACERAGRDPGQVQLLLATKTVTVDKLRLAMAAGETLFGENRVQELQQKAEAMAQEKPQWHFIGHLQTNKVRHVIRWATCIHSVDRLRLGQRLHNRLARENKRMDILIQVNTTGEASKFGVAVKDVHALVEQLAQLPALRIKGLMTIGKFGAGERETRGYFRRLKAIQEAIAARRLPGVDMDVLSMGMSGDFEVAIEEGATLVRVGTAVFGERMVPDSYYWNEAGRSS